MNYRVFSKTHNCYLGEEFVLTQDGKPLHLEFPTDKLDPRDFIVEPFTGFYDSGGRKIFVGDILTLKCFELSYKVVWNQDRFGMVPLYEGSHPLLGVYHFSTQKDLSVGWSVTGNIHEKSIS